jgi:hypothetical protein
MSQNTVKQTQQPLSPRPAVKQSDTVNLTQEALDEQQERLRKAAAAGAAALTAPAPVAVKRAPAPATVPSKPLAPLAALWPDPVPPKGESKPSQAPTPQVQKAPVAATTPKPAPAVAAPLPPPLAQSAPPTTAEKAAVTTPASAPAAPQSIKVTFALFEPEAKQLAVSGDFNGWVSEATPMKRGEGGRWATTISLAPGRYQYKFVADGRWIPDPLAHENIVNQHGTLNSVIEVRS